MPKEYKLKDICLSPMITEIKFFNSDSFFSEKITDATRMERSFYSTVKTKKNCRVSKKNNKLISLIIKPEGLLWLFKCCKTIRKIIIFFKQKICIIFTKILFFSVIFFFQIKLFI